MTIFGDKNRFLSSLFMLMVAASAGFLGGWIGASSKLQRGNLTSTPTQQAVINESQLISKVAKNIGPSVVSVNVVTQGVGTNFFGRQQVFNQEGAGTGFFISGDVIVTNRHVVPKSVTKITVTLSDGTELTDVEVIGRTNENDSLDVAFLRVKDRKGKDIKPVKLGDSSKMQVGDKVIAIGNALGQFQNIVTTGIISGFGRNVEAEGELIIETLQNLFQTDAAINQGNSGGPLVNINGEVIGINTAIAGDGENIGFALPINDIQGLVKSVLETGKLQRAYLGIRYISLTDEIATKNDLPAKRGAYLAPTGDPSLPTVLTNSPASKAGLKEKDIITKLNDITIDENNSLTSALGRFSVGQTVNLTVLRDGQAITVQVTVEAAPTD